jgi:hypothetical protein
MSEWRDSAQLEMMSITTDVWHEAEVPLPVRDQKDHVSIRMGFACFPDRLTDCPQACCGAGPLTGTKGDQVAPLAQPSSLS